LNERLLVAGLCAFLISLVLTPIVRLIARRRSALDQPNDRSSHAIPVPRLGGIAVVTGTVGGGLVAIQYVDLRIALIGCAGVLLAAIGFVDDLKPISPLQKYVAQVTAALASAFAVAPTLAVNLFDFEVRFNGLSANLVAALWILVIINALNFMDGIDGLAAGVGAIVGFAIPALTNGAGAFMLLPLAAALLGFLAWNTSPASIFMGDVGSQFVGLVLAVGSLHWPAGDVRLVPVLIIFAPLLFDTGYTLLRRLYLRQNIFRAHRTHLYQRLVAIGYTHRGVANLYYCMTAISLGLAVAFVNSRTVFQIIIISFLAASGALYVIIVDRLERSDVIWDFLLPSSGLTGASSTTLPDEGSIERSAD
jgi:UDP-N-acetylmuramyl pentapeptide phosphotransferase/UDP-N-acetylglucosamine-1-phosphate transferase